MEMNSAGLVAWLWVLRVCMLAELWVLVSSVYDRNLQGVY